eukprot:1270977-Prymnesium_polylepis.2
MQERQKGQTTIATATGAANTRHASSEVGLVSFSDAGQLTQGPHALATNTQSSWQVPHAQVSGGSVTSVLDFGLGLGLG